MECQCEKEWFKEGDHEPTCIFVCCDQDCRALKEPDLNNLEQVTRAYGHWAGHSYMCGCSHGC